ncbi:hypothetical protein V494_04021 [Pseudogymnoascus sp. VKM F-4513 (FW-928)]|nr:hypothetical protein V494_04021 [Pseudogymnoascus sp. VKM F-4513 (FW-928)]
MSTTLPAPALPSTTIVPSYQPGTTGAAAGAGAGAAAPASGELGKPEQSMTLAGRLEDDALGKCLWRGAPTRAASATKQLRSNIPGRAGKMRAETGGDEV